MTLAVLIDFTIGRGGRAPVIGVTFEDDTGPVTIQDAVVTFRMVNASGQVVLDEVPATNLDTGTPETKGMAEYAWDADDTDLPGLFTAWFTATSAGRALIAPKRVVQPFLLISII